MANLGPNTQDPNSVLYQFIDTQPADEYPVAPPAGDSSLSHFTTRQFTPTGITAARPPVVTKTAHGLINGDVVRATKFVRFPIANRTGMYQLQNQQFTIQQATTDTFQLWTAAGYPVDGRNFDAYITGGQFTQVGETLTVVNPSVFPPRGIPDPWSD